MLTAEPYPGFYSLPAGPSRSRSGVPRSGLGDAANLLAHCQVTTRPGPGSAAPGNVICCWAAATVAVCSGDGLVAINRSCRGHAWRPTQSGRTQIRFTHSSGSLAAQIMTSCSTASGTERRCGISRTPGLWIDWTNSPKCRGIVFRSWLTSTLPASAAAAKTSLSGRATNLGGAPKIDRRLLASHG